MAALLLPELFGPTTDAGVRKDTIVPQNHPLRYSVPQGIIAETNQQTILLIIQIARQQAVTKIAPQEPAGVDKGLIVRPDP